ncbi:DUF2795 domain-containing protein [Actinomadura fulvescens]|uniref:DUF2795 domain-containing protein n=1 Tax=Actinomadura fulvescens TaxID=46160 RepID=A0ABP6D076_9ACTN
MRAKSTDQIKNVLGDLAFPADKDQIVEHARRHGADTETERALSALPLGEYDSVKEVQRSVPLDPDPDRSEAERSEQRRHHNKAGLAEHMREADEPPVQQELNRDIDRGGPW